MDYGKYLTDREDTPQTEVIPGREADMAKNNAGGVSFTITPWQQLNRFLILGSEGGSYYATERSMTLDNIKCLQECLKLDGERVVREAVEISKSGRAVKNDAAIFALAMALNHRGTGYQSGQDAEVVVRRAAREAVPEVCRTGTHLFQLAQFLKPFGTWSNAQRRAFDSWYHGKSEENLAYQLIKYQQREGWTHRDILRRAHTAPRSETQDALFHWAVKGWDDIGSEPHPDPVLCRVWAFEKAKRSESVAEVVELIDTYNLPRECIPTQMLNDTKIWEALLQKMPMTALIRNLGKMSSLGMLTNMNENTKLIVNRLNDEERLKRARIHPMNVLNALKTYSSGRGFRGSNTWSVVPKIVDALDDAFYKSFDFVEPTGKRILIGVDISGSMTMGSVAGMSALTPREAEAAMAMTIMRTEENWEAMAFSTKFTPMKLSPKQRLDDVLREIGSYRHGGTDCSLPFTWAKQNKREFDAFIVMTDNETYAGRPHPSQALKQYRKATGIPARSAVLAFTATQFSIADPEDAGMLDITGCDSKVPQLLNAFFRGDMG